MLQHIRNHLYQYLKLIKFKSNSLPIPEFENQKFVMAEKILLHKLHLIETT